MQVIRSDSLTGEARELPGRQKRVCWTFADCALENENCVSHRPKFQTGLIRGSANELGDRMGDATTADVNLSLGGLRHTMPKAKRLTHEESKAQTRSRLISVGREHFLRYGFSKSTAEDIAEEAGYTRGALRSNFGDKEGLFLAVVTEGRRAEAKMFKEVVSRLIGEELVTALREGFADLMADPDYLLMLEFALECLRNDVLRSGYMAFHKEMIDDSCKILKNFQEQSGVVLTVPMEDFVLIVQSFSRGLTTNLILDPSLEPESVRRMMYSVFDSLILRPGTAEKSKRSRPKKS